MVYLSVQSKKLADVPSPRFRRLPERLVQLATSLETIVMENMNSTPDFGSSARAAVRWSIHLLVRLVIAATCNSPAAAFDAAHVLHAAEVMLRHGHSLAVRRREARSNSQPTTTGCALPGKSSFAAQQEGAFQPKETEELGRQ